MFGWGPASFTSNEEQKYFDSLDRKQNGGKTKKETRIATTESTASQGHKRNRPTAGDSEHEMNKRQKPDVSPSSESSQRNPWDEARAMDYLIHVDEDEITQARKTRDATRDKFESREQVELFDKQVVQMMAERQKARQTFTRAAGSTSGRNDALISVSAAPPSFEDLLEDEMLVTEFVDERLRAQLYRLEMFDALQITYLASLWNGSATVNDTARPLLGGREWNLIKICRYAEEVMGIDLVCASLYYPLDLRESGNKWIEAALNDLDPTLALSPPCVLCGLDFCIDDRSMFYLRLLYLAGTSSNSSSTSSRLKLKLHNSKESVERLLGALNLSHQNTFAEVDRFSLFEHVRNADTTKLDSSSLAPIPAALASLAFGFVGFYYMTRPESYNEAERMLESVKNDFTYSF